jgi:hypothetical protein
MQLPATLKLPAELSAPLWRCSVMAGCGSEKQAVCAWAQPALLETNTEVLGVGCLTYTAWCMLLCVVALLYSIHGVRGTQTLACWFVCTTRCDGACCSLNSTPSWIGRSQHVCSSRALLLLLFPPAVLSSTDGFVRWCLWAWNVSRSRCVAEQRERCCAHRTSLCLCAVRESVCAAAVSLCTLLFICIPPARAGGYLPPSVV